MCDVGCQAVVATFSCRPGRPAKARNLSRAYPMPSCRRALYPLRQLNYVQRDRVRHHAVGAALHADSRGVCCCPIAARMAQGPAPLGRRGFQLARARAPARLESHGRRQAGVGVGDTAGGAGVAALSRARSLGALRSQGPGLRRTTSAAVRARRQISGVVRHVSFLAAAARCVGDGRWLGVDWHQLDPISQTHNRRMGVNIGPFSSAQLKVTQ